MPEAYFIKEKEEIVKGESKLNDGGNRIGTVSSVNAETGMVSVVYEDRDDEVTEFLPYATFNDEYKLPQIGAKVVVLHLSNGSEMGIILGTYWNEQNAAGAQGVYHKNLGEGAYLDYDGTTFTIGAKQIQFKVSGDRELKIADIVDKIEKIEQKLDLL